MNSNLETKYYAVLSDLSTGELGKARDGISDILSQKLSAHLAAHNSQVGQENSTLLPTEPTQAE